MKAAPQPGSLAPLVMPSPETEAPPLEPVATDNRGDQATAEPPAETVDSLDASSAAEMPAIITLAKKDEDES